VTGDVQLATVGDVSLRVDCVLVYIVAIGCRPCSLLAAAAGFCGMEPSFVARVATVTTAESALAVAAGLLVRDLTGIRPLARGSRIHWYDPLQGFVVGKQHSLSDHLHFLKIGDGLG